MLPEVAEIPPCDSERGSEGHWQPEGLVVMYALYIGQVLKEQKNEVLNLY